MVDTAQQGTIVDDLDQSAHRLGLGASTIEHAIAFACQRVGYGVAVGVGQDRLHFLTIVVGAYCFQA